jgi:uncharacterized damage-inducible protein DinB
MRLADIQILMDYLYWTRDRVLGAAQDLPSEVFAAPDPLTARNLRDTLVHELDVEWSWRERLTGAPPEAWGPDAELKPAEYPTAALIAEHWRRDEAAMRGWLRSLSDDILDAPPPNAGRTALPLWMFLMHIVSHGMQQFSDAAVLLTAAGRSPGEIEFLEFADSLESPVGGAPRTSG